ncbi:MAG: peptidylprolyl isomerase [Hyphomicrobiaceae bacterium]|nr:peptidylprolyl isomerase [Hyphomicrobiaceae bacterium]
MPGLTVAQPNMAPPAAAAPAQAAPQKAKAKPKTVKPAAPVDAATASGGKGQQSIIMLVNDEPVTAYEVQQRARFMSLGSGVQQQAQENFKRLAQSEGTNNRFRAIVEKMIKDNQATKTRDQIIAMIEAKKKEFATGLQKEALDSARAANIPKHKKDAQEEIIEEKLKLQEARKNGVEVSDDEVNRILKGIAAQNKQTDEQFAGGLKAMGVDIATMRARFRANLAWREVVRRKFAAQISINQRDVDRLVAKSATAANADDGTELQIQRVVYALPAKLDQMAMARTLADADALRRGYSGCKSLPQLAKAQPSAKLEDMKFIKASSVSEPTRSMLVNAKDGDLLPPQTGAAGVELYAVCGRKTGKPDDTKREAAQQELQQQQFEQMAKKHLRDLRQDAHIETR